MEDVLNKLEVVAIPGCRLLSDGGKRDGPAHGRILLMFSRHLCWGQILAGSGFLSMTKVILAVISLKDPQDRMIAESGVPGSSDRSWLVLECHQV